ncbi:hypothetical protein RirG_143130 [Rhizophagus irregularis DAOM 197198w]|uniref:Secreted protein n=1 Tax=Rhizophagus irregularis (strain DAOM 197198w) TaxID=1432141 RepID=A0A015JBU7_RHIIW|nr:hypothetical protein RirG_143130 [Rhizophagus irregularis DAOM 197198w]
MPNLFYYFIFLLRIGVVGLDVGLATAPPTSASWPRSTSFPPTGDQESPYIRHNLGQHMEQIYIPNN